MEKASGDEPAKAPPVRRIAVGRSSKNLMLPAAPSTADGLLSVQVPARAVPAKPGLYNLGLNAGSSGQAQALPVRRRGSFQSLKRATPGADTDDDGPSTSGSSSATSCTTAGSSHLAAPDTQLGGIRKKKTHWEAYGTVMVLFTALDGEKDANTVLQMLSAEGYDAQTAQSSEQTLTIFDSQAVYPDVVLIDSDHAVVDCKKLIKQLFSLNPTVAIIVLGSATSPLTAVAALQVGAADFMRKPLDLEELVARVERHVQRQHCIKLELETAFEEARKLMQQMSASPAAKAALVGPPPPAETGLGAVAETEFEEQMSDLSEENQRLGARLQEVERQLELRMVS